MKKWMIKVLKVSIGLVGLIALLLCVFWLPNVAKYFAENAPEFAYLRYPALIGLYITGIPFYLGIFHTFKLLNLIEIEGAFTEKACNSLNSISRYALAEIVLYIMGMIFLSINNAGQPGIFLLGLVIIFTAFIIYVFASILRGLLMKVVEIKNENDLTI